MRKGRRNSKRKREALQGRSKRKTHWLKRLLIPVALIALAVAILVILVYGTLSLRYDLSKLGEMPERSIVYDVNGNEYSRLFGENRIKISLASVSPFFVKALIAREDSRFMDHHGVDPRGIARAVMRNITRGSVREGASTITQQLARNSFPLGGQNLHRKLLEAAVAFRIESKFSKDEILEHYINRIYYGTGLYGLETASQAYFNKHAVDLTLGESALMAGLIRSPNRFSPLKNPTGAKRERDTVLDRMVELKAISQAQADEARRAPVVVNAKRLVVAQENYAMDAVVRDLEVLLTEDEMDQGGLKIFTTIDPVIQKAAAMALNKHLTEIEGRAGYKHPARSSFTEAQEDAETGTPYLQGAVVVIDNRTGGIRALVGGRDFEQSKFNRAIQAKRQLGSSFKPFVFAAAFQSGLFPGTVTDDGPIRRGEVPEAPGWSPSNSDGTFLGPQFTEVGLIKSRNTMTVRVGEFAGIERVRKTAERAGLGSDIPNTPSIFLGSFETTLKELTTAYTVFPNQGLRRQSYIVERIDGITGKTLYRAAHLEIPAISKGAAWLTTRTLIEVIERGTAASARSLGFKKTAAGKTGTTNDYYDAWFTGFTTSLTCGVWVGLDKPDRIMSGGYGSTLALPVWVEVMNSAPAKMYPANDFQPGEALRQVSLCSVSGKLATAGCGNARTAYVDSIPVSLVPTTRCPVHDGHVLPAGETQDDSPPEKVFRTIRKFFGGE